MFHLSATSLIVSSVLLPLLVLLFFVVFIAVTGGIIFLIVGSIRKNLSRQKALPALAASLGLPLETGTYHPGVPPFAATADFALFRSKDTPSITNVLHGRLGNVDVQLFDYSYFDDMGVGADAHSTRFDHWVAMLTAEGFSLPSSLDVTPRNFLDRAAASLGRQSIEFTEYPDLSRQYVFGAFDEKFLRALFDPATAAWFVQHPGIFVHGDGQHLVVYRAEQISEAAAMRGFVDEAMTIFQIVAAGTARVMGQQTRTLAPPPLPI